MLRPCGTRVARPDSPLGPSGESGRATPAKESRLLNFGLAIFRPGAPTGRPIARTTAPSLTPLMSSWSREPAADTRGRGHLHHAHRSVATREVALQRAAQPRALPRELGQLRRGPGGHRGYRRLRRARRGHRGLAQGLDEPRRHPPEARAGGGLAPTPQNMGRARLW